MRIKPLKNKQQKQAAKIFWVLFPFLGFWLVFKLFRFLLGHHQFYSVKPKKSRNFLGLMAFTSLFFLRKKWFYLQYLAVDKTQQGRGLGSKMLKLLEHKAKRKKHHYFFLFSPPWRPSAQRFYLKRGFKRLIGFIFWKRLK